ncbi:efflux RND transporter permease subunit [Microbispora bryophytorum]|uniref:efflux RND transporter permease subunit n=1 Tax=Microbispora bryophytorum TaxID=1460882 RepID=UPI001158EB49|nr:efflux RND transporter permease subunit [Microbispora bryophytorum]MBD3137299.1 efflux RND transporter permease subunit [Microbispora bryophytorum]TQS06755.1 efflux RND transporter permease subunit [Microbispora bryophytorum]
MTSLARLSLANRTLVIMITLVLAGLGLFAIPSLKQQLFPSLEFPAAFTVASYPGAAPEIVEEQVTKPIESAFQGIAGVTDITSTSREGMAQVQVAYEYGTDIDQMIAKMQQAVSRIKTQLPADVDPQVVAGSTDDIPVMALAVGDGGDQHAMADKIEKIMVPELQSIEGVRDVAVSGAREEQVVITPEQGRLAARGLSAAAIPDLLRANGVSIPAGTLSEDGKSLTVQIGDPVRTVKDLENLYLAPAAPAAGQGTPAGQGAAAGARGGASAGQATGQTAGQGTAAGQGAAQPRTPVARPKPVKLGDVADIKVEDTSATTLTRTNGTPSLGVSITMVPDGNAVQISHDVNDALPDLTRALGDSAELTVVFDQAPYVERSIEDLTTEGLLGLAFAVLVILVFLLSVRSTLVTAVSIPLSVVIALIALWIGDYSLNLLTLGALTIAVGRVVDDSIVVLENIKRHLAYGEEKRRAILGAVREVSGAVTASTLTTVAVFLPIAFVGGMVGQLFSPFAITVTVALLASLLVALTVIPVLAYWFLKAPALTPQEAQAVREDAERKELRSPLQRIYLPVLRFATRRRLVTLLIGVVVFAATMALAPNLKTNFLDNSGNDTTQISQRMPAGTDLATTDAAAKKVETVLAADGGVESYQVTVGGGNRFLGGVGGGSDHASFSITLKEGVETSALEDRLRDGLKGLTGIGDITVGGSGGGGFNSNQVQVIVQGSDQAALKTAATTVRDAMAEIGGLRDVASNLEDSVPRVEVHVDREKAAARGLTEAGIGQLVAQAFRGAPVGSIDVDGRSSDVILRAGGDAPEDIAAIRKLAIPTATGMVKLGDVADVVQADGPTQITRQDGDRTATVSGTAEASDLGAITTKVTDTLKTLTLPAGVTYKIGGASSQQQDAFADLGLAMLLAVAIVFMIMVATFRSLMQPLILLVSVPFAATGAIGLLLATDTALGVPALIGMLMLIGIVVTNAIVLIDLINQYREQGLGVVEAVMEGGRRRLRPILMTAIATICALTPMALGVTGSGGFISQPLAIVVIGGLISSTLLTLVLVPTLYTMVERLKERMRRTPEQPASGGGDGDLTVYGKEALEPAK